MFKRLIGLMLIASFILPNLLVAGHAVSTEEVQEHQHNFVSSQCQECGEYQYNITLYILRNDYADEYFLTDSEAERDQLIGYGWTYCGTTVGRVIKFRLYNVKTGEHYFTRYEETRDSLISDNIVYEGPMIMPWCEGAHTPITVPGRAPTCINTGFTEYSYCSECQELITIVEELPLGAHTEVTTEGIPPTCTNQGWTESIYCSTCHETLVPRQPIPAANVPHVEVTDPAVEPTCKTDGKTAGSHCSVCGTTIISQKIIPAAHRYVKNVCQVCGDVKCDGMIGENLYWQYDDSSKTLRIWGTGPMKDAFSVIGSSWGSEVTTVIIEEGVTSIASDTFSAYKNLVNISIPSSVTKIGDFAFWNCTSLKEIVLPEGIPDIPLDAFRGCTSLENIVIPDSVTVISQGSFMGCTSLAKITIPAKVTKIGFEQWFGAFANCTGLKEITFKGNAPEISIQADHLSDAETFENVTATVYYPANDPTWTADVMQNYGGNLTWIPSDGSSGGNSGENTGGSSGEGSVEDQLQDLVTENSSPEEIRETVQKMDTEDLKAAMIADTDNSGAVANIAALEQATGGCAQIQVKDPSCGFTPDQVSIVGANLNGNGNVALVIGSLEGKEAVPSYYDHQITIYFSMDLSNVEDTENLDVPVKISLPVPETMDHEEVVIIHYHANGIAEVLQPEIQEKNGTYYASIVLSSFSDFAMTQPPATSQPGAAVRTTVMYRMYDPNYGEHFYTGNLDERNNLVSAGWKYEGVGFNFPVVGEPVYRLYEPVNGEHLYTMDVAEKDALIAKGWRYENVAFNSAGTDEVPQYRLHNPNAQRGAYHFTGSTAERDHLISLGWEDQGIGWYSSWK